MMHDLPSGRPRSGLAFLLVLLLAVPQLARSAETVNAPAMDERSSAQKLEQMRRDGILRDPVWAHAYWARASAAPSRSARISDLHWALRFDPDMLSARIKLAVELARAGDPECTTQIVEMARRIKTSFVAQQQLALLVLKIGGGVSLLVLVTSALFAVIRRIASIRHALTERLSFLPAEARTAGAILSLCAPLLLALALPPTSAIFWALLMGTVAAWTLLVRWERRICLWALAGLLLAPFGVALWVRLLEPSYPDAYTRLLWEAQSTEDPWTLASLRRADPRTTAENPDHLATLALIARRERNFAEAQRLLQRALELRPDDWGLHNNLGNVFLLSGKSESALAAYRRAKERAPAEPRIRVNEAQAWMERLDVARAQAALEEARRLGYHAPPTTESSATGMVVLEETLSSRELWKALLADLKLKKSLSWKRAAEMSLSVVAPFRSIPLLLPLLLALFYASQARHLPRLHSCASCGKTICRKCHYRVLRESLCAECFGIRQRVRTPIQREEALSKRRQRVRLAPWCWGVALAALVPGIGHLYEGRRGWAILLLFTWFSYLVLASGPHSPGHAPLILLLFAAVSVLGYLRCASRRDARAALSASRRV
jgi:tetratricopeptide (TPR) repeat protein